VLWSCATAAAAAFVVLYFTTRLGLSGAPELNAAYGIYLLLAAVVIGVFALFKTYGERQARPLKLIADERRSMWGQAKQPSGQVFTTLSLHFQATNCPTARFIYQASVCAVHGCQGIVSSMR
jgi:hypothetical protein